MVRTTVRHALTVCRIVVIGSSVTFVGLFVVGRLPGWTAQWRKMINGPQARIGRPRQLYAGLDKRDLSARTSTRRPDLVPLEVRDHARSTSTRTHREA